MWRGIHVAADALAARFALEQRIHSTLDSLDRRLNEALALRARLEPIAAARAQARSALAALDSEISGDVQLESTSSEGPLLYAKLDAAIARGKETL